MSNSNNYKFITDEYNNHRKYNECDSYYDSYYDNEYNYYSDDEYNDGDNEYNRGDEYLD